MDFIIRVNDETLKGFVIIIWNFIPKNNIEILELA